jgi:hypothetical protein
MRRFLTFVFSLAILLPAHTQVTINELLASNAITNIDPDYQEFSDWVELYNPGPSAVNLSGWHLSDDNDLPAKWTFPAGTSIGAGTYLLVWADGVNSGMHTNFKLSADGEKMYLTDASGTEIDRRDFGAQQTDISLGRSVNGAGNWGYFTHPTPGASNSTSTFFTDFILNVPVFSQAGGFFDTPLTINIKNLSGIGVLRYTLDGSIPNNNSPEWTADINLTTTTVVKARLFETGKISGPVLTNTYFINEHFQERGLAVLSLSTNPDYFFAADSGIYVQNFKPEWEIPIHLEFYEPDGLLGFHHDAGASIGGENAWILPEKLLNISSRKQYGAGKIDYQIFPHNPRNEFEDLILRCSGNDWSNTLFRDGMQQGLAASTADALDIQDFRPCAVFINGAYFGIHNIREKQDKEYANLYHGISTDSLDYIENNGEVKEGNVDAYQQMVDLLSAGVTSAASFEALEKMCDTKNFSDYIISQIFTANTSWGHNIALFRKRSPDGKWRWFPHDYDRGFDLGNLGSTAMSWATATNGADWTNPAWGTLFLRKMLENDAFKDRFITRFADHLYVTYNPLAINKRVDKHANWIRSEIPYHVARWLGTTSSYGNAMPSVSFWENEVTELKTFGQQRNTFIFNDLSQYFNLSGSVGLQVQVAPAERGWVKLHDLRLPAYPWSGNYLKNRAFTLTAEPKPGFNFVRWEKSEASVLSLLEPSTNWRYSDATSAPPGNWNQPGFNAASWTEGAAELGYGDGDESTTLLYGSDSNNKTIAYYFRKTFNISDPSAFANLAAKMVVDDGAVVYLNGQEVWRYNMPSGSIDFTTLASATISAAGESTWNEQILPTDALVAGENVLAVEIHQAAANSSDLSFNFQLSGQQAGNMVTVSTNPALEYTLGDNPEVLRAVFESDGTCGVLPDTIRENLTLLAACSPYRAAGDVVVLPNVTLSVEAGVTILFPEKSNLWVHGNLMVDGLENAPVIIKAAPGSSEWGGILLQNTTAFSELKYLTLEHASAGPQRLYFPAAISAYKANIGMDFLTLTAVHDNPIFSRFSYVYLGYSTIKSSVTGDCINVKNGNCQIIGCDFSANAMQPDMDAIDLDGVPSALVTHNVIHDFRGDNNDAIDIGESSKDVLILDNFIYHCLDKGISVGQQSSVHILSNVIAYTGYGIALKDQSTARIDACTFFGNQQAVAAYQKNPGNWGGNGIIKDCIASNAAFGSFVSDAFSTMTVENSLSDTDTLSGNNLHADPLFVNPTLYDFQLLPNSPASGISTMGGNLGAVPFQAYTGQPQLLFSEILYDDTLTSTGEFLEILNPGTEAIDLQGYTIANALNFVFPTGVSIGPGEYIVVAKDAGNFNNAGFQVFEWTDGKLADEGEAIHLFDLSGLLVDFVRFDNHAPWPERSTLLGKSLELVSENLDNHFSTSWRPSNGLNGSPGTPGSISSTFSPLPSAQIEVYPNPVSDQITIAVKQIHGNSFSVQMTDSKGAAVLEQTFAGVQATLKLPRMAAGLYFLSVFDTFGGLLGFEKVVVK